MESTAAAVHEMFCPHCGDTVPKSTFYRHRSRFYDPVSGIWNDDTPSSTAAALSTDECDSSDQLGELTEDLDPPMDHDRPMNLQEHTHRPDTSSNTQRALFRVYL